ncbi:hypothetical protein ACRXB1_36920, partial [Caballeronia sp. M23-90]
YAESFCDDPHALAPELGAEGIAKPFRVAPGSAFRSATAQELKLQLDAYRGYRTYLFDGPHYVPPQLVDSLLQ